MKLDKESKLSPECAWLFDVDGVITNPEQKKVTEPQILDEIIERLQKGEPVVLVTGRSLDWLLEKVVKFIEEKAENKTSLDNLFISGEFGGSYLKYQNGQRELFVNNEISVPQEATNEAREITNQQFSKSMFFDPTKKTMVSVEMNDRYDVKKFRGPQKILVTKLQQLLEERNLADKFEVHVDRNGTNIRSRIANKAYAARQVIEWLKVKNIKPRIFIIIGDITSDLEMAEEVTNKGKQVEFVFVGEPEQLTGQHFPFQVTLTKSRFEKGTLEVLKK